MLQLPTCQLNPPPMVSPISPWPHPDGHFIDWTCPLIIIEVNDSYYIYLDVPIPSFLGGYDLSPTRNKETMKVFQLH